MRVFLDSVLYLCLWLSCLQMIPGPLAWATDEFQAQKDACKAPNVWNTARNMCEVPATTRALREATNQQAEACDQTYQSALETCAAKPEGEQDKCRKDAGNAQKACSDRFASSAA